jgi:hypothetical protein
MNALRLPSIAKAMGKRKITIPKFTGSPNLIFVTNLELNTGIRDYRDVKPSIDISVDGLRGVVVPINVLTGLECHEPYSLLITLKTVNDAFEIRCWS